MLDTHHGEITDDAIKAELFQRCAAGRLMSVKMPFTAMRTIIETVGHFYYPNRFDARTLPCRSH